MQRFSPQGFVIPALITLGMLNTSVLAAPVAVTIQDGVNPPTACGDLQSLDVSATSVSLISNGDCLGGGFTGTTPVAENFGPFSVETGRTLAVDVSTGAVVTLPQPLIGAEVLIPPANGSASFISESLINYVAPQFADYTSGNGNFTYRLFDATGFDDATVSINIIPVDNGDTCVPTTTLTCGTVSQFPNPNSDFDIPILAGHIHALAFDYVSQTGLLGPYNGHPKEVAISATPGSFITSDPECSFIQVVNSQKVSYGPEGSTTRPCPLIPNTRYYLNIRNLQSTTDEYRVGGSGS